MPTLLCRKEIKALLRSAITYPNRKTLAEYIDSQESIPNWDRFLIQMPELRGKYWQVFIALYRELVSYHMSSEGVYTKLWQLFKEVVLNTKRYETSQHLNQKRIKP